MKRKIGILLVCLMLALTACVLSGCFGDKSDGGVSTHEHRFYTCIDQTAPTCTEDGTKTYKCECGETKVNITESSFGGHVKPSELTPTLPTCTEDGKVEYTCGRCNEQVTEVIPAKGHEKTAYEEVKANCTNVGYTGGFYCTACEAVLEERTELPVNGEHVSVPYEEVEANCGFVGYTGGTYCSVCETTLTERTEIPVQGEHTSANYENVDATCGTAGYKGGTYCTVCEKTLSARTEIPATGAHTEIDVPAVAPTCAQTGLSAGKQCSVCKVFTVPQSEVGKVDHKYQYSMITAPAYQVAGVGQYCCSVCADTYEEEIPALTYQPSDIWTGDVAEGFASGDGTKENPYIIMTAAQLAYFARQSGSGENFYNKYVALGADIVLNDTTNYKSWSKTNAPANKWSPIGTSGGGFLGNFDGCGHTIYGLYVYQKKMSSGTNYYAGLFGCVSNGTIQNLTIADAYVHSDHSAVGGLVGYVDASDSYVTIKNCHFNGTVVGVSHAGGLIGTARCGWVGHDYVGGSIAAVCHDGTLTISDCTAKGRVASDNMMLPSNDCYVGGIAGYVYYACGTVRISGCTNYADVSSKSNAGGIAGILCPSDSNRDSVSFSISMCTNKGSVTANKDAGGIASRLQYTGKSSSYDTVAITNCSNSGKILSNALNENACVGGLFGDLRSSGTQYCDIYNLYNLGDVVVNGKAYNVGGIAGGLTLESNYSILTFKNSFNSGNVTVVNASNVGGLFGYSYASWQRPYTLDCCYNDGDITSGGQNVGGLFGNVSNATITNSYNLGSITGGDKKVGGLAGYGYGITVKTSYNAGKVSGTGVYVGAIIGQNENANIVSYFKEGCATDGKGLVQGASGSDRNSTGSTNYSLNEAAMYNQSSYKTFDFSKIWNAPSSADGTYPTLKNVVKAPTEE